MVVNKEIHASIAQMVKSDDLPARLAALRFTTALGVIASEGDRKNAGKPTDDGMNIFWFAQGDEDSRLYRNEIVDAAAHDAGMRTAALTQGLISIEDSLEMTGGLLPLLQPQHIGFFGATWVPYLISRFFSVANEDLIAADSAAELKAVGDYIIRHPAIPWTREGALPWSQFTHSEPPIRLAQTQPDPITYLGGAAIMFISAEADSTLPSRHFGGDPSKLGAFCDLYPYIERRHARSATSALPDLPVPGEFKQLFRDWAEGKVNFTAPASDPPSRS
jgi:hypothetical protein